MDTTNDINEEKKEEKIEENKDVNEKASVDIVETTKKKNLEPEAVIDLASEDKEKEPRALHKTSSIFLRNLAPTITKAEVEAVSKQFVNYIIKIIVDCIQKTRESFIYYDIIRQ